MEGWRVSQSNAVRSSKRKFRFGRFPQKPGDYHRNLKTLGDHESLTLLPARFHPSMRDLRARLEFTVKQNPPAGKQTKGFGRAKIFQIA
jgi:hypothetical protein